MSYVSWEKADSLLIAKNLTVPTEPVMQEWIYNNKISRVYGVQSSQNKLFLFFFLPTLKLLWFGIVYNTVTLATEADSTVLDYSHGKWYLQWTKKKERMFLNLD